MGKMALLDVIRTLLRGASSESHAVSDFEVVLFLDTLSCFASVSWRVLKCSKNWSRSKVGPFPSQVVKQNVFYASFGQIQTRGGIVRTLTDIDFQT